MRFMQLFGQVNDFAIGALVAAAALGLGLVAGLLLYAVIEMAPGSMFFLYA